MSGVSRKTGAECPWSGHQIFSYFVYLGSVFVFFIQVVESYEIREKVPVILLYCIFLLLVLYYHTKLTFSDPTDPIVKAFKNAESQA